MKQVLKYAFILIVMACVFSLGASRGWAQTDESVMQEPEPGEAEFQDEPKEAEPVAPLRAGRPTPLDEWFGIKDDLNESGIDFAFSPTFIYQINLQGGTSTHNRSGRFAGSYDLELELDFEKLFEIPGGSLYVLGEGSWSSGLDASSVGSVYWGVNTDALGDEWLRISKLRYTQEFFDGKLRFRLGKLSLFGGFVSNRGPWTTFDTNAYANEETLQFLNGVFVNNPTIPWPGLGLGAVAYAEPADWWYVSAGVGDAQSQSNETGFNTTFHDEDYFVSMYETGFLPQFKSSKGMLQGAYRIGLWYDPQPKAALDGTGTGRDDVGAFASFDQELWRENDDPADAQGLGAFCRLGWADANYNNIKRFWSVGTQYKGAIPCRDKDVVAAAFGQQVLSDEAGYAAWHESVMEVYYRAVITRWLSVSPSFQYIWNPGGVSGNDAMIAGVRMQFYF